MDSRGPITAPVPVFSMTSFADAFEQYADSSLPEVIEKFRAALDDAGKHSKVTREGTTLTVSGVTEAARDCFLACSIHEELGYRYDFERGTTIPGGYDIRRSVREDGDSGLYSLILTIYRPRE
jgi:hypothetical protein